MKTYTNQITIELKPYDCNTFCRILFGYSKFLSIFPWKEEEKKK